MHRYISRHFCNTLGIAQLRLLPLSCMQIIPKRVFLANNSLHSFPKVCALLFVRDQNAYVAMHEEIFKPRVLWGGSSFIFASFFLILSPIHLLSQKLRKKNPKPHFNGCSMPQCAETSQFLCKIHLGTSCLPVTSCCEQVFFLYRLLGVLFSLLKVCM